jgi:hypothetical protein
VSLTERAGQVSYSFGSLDPLRHTNGLVGVSVYSTRLAAGRGTGPVT